VARQSSRPLSRFLDDRQLVAGSLGQHGATVGKKADFRFFDII